jgi:hypothetical protein
MTGSPAASFTVPVTVFWAKAVTPAAKKARVMASLRKRFFMCIVGFKVNNRVWFRK